MSVKLFSQSSVANSKFTGLPASGAVALKDADISGTTGSPTTATYTSGGINYKTYKFTGSGSITFSKSGLVDWMLVGGGGGGFPAYGGGGGGSLIHQYDCFVSAATYTLTVGAGGGDGSRGNVTTINLGTNAYYSLALPGNTQPYGYDGGQAGMGLSSSLGYFGGGGNTNSGGGGGGIGAAGGASSANYGGTGGAGIYSTFATGSNVGYGGGGGGGGYLGGGSGATAYGAGNGGTNVGGSAGTANTGGGGGGRWTGGTGGGGSGVIVVRVRV